MQDGTPIVAGMRVRTRTTLASPASIVVTPYDQGTRRADAPGRVLGPAAAGDDTWFIEHDDRRVATYGRDEFDATGDLTAGAEG
jgi:hypothetical protein